MNRVLVLSTQSGDWEGLFIDGVLISEGHHLGEGRPAEFWINKSKEYSFESKDIVQNIQHISAVSHNAAEQVQSVSAAGEQQAASVEEVASASKALAILAEELQSALKGFHL